jgi:hypothetical protein
MAILRRVQSEHHTNGSVGKTRRQMHPLSMGLELQREDWSDEDSWAGVSELSLEPRNLFFLQKILA